MSTRRVSVLCIDDRQKAEVRKILTGPVETNGDYLMGLADKAGQDELEAGGYLYNLEPGLPKAATSATVVSMGARRGTSQTLDDAQADDEGGSARVVLDLTTPLGPALIDRLDKVGVEIDERTGPATYVARYSGTLDTLNDIAQVHAARWYDRSTTLRASDLLGNASTTLAPDPDEGERVVRVTRGPRMTPSRPRNMTDFSIASDDGPDFSSDGASFDDGDSAAESADEVEFATAASAPVVVVGFDVRCHTDDEIDACAGAIAAIPDVQNVEKGAQRIRFWVPVDQADAIQRRVAGLAQTAIVEPYIRPETLLNFVRNSLWGTGGPAAHGAWTGDGETVAVADTGIDLQHPDFTGRVTIIGPTDLPPDRDPQGHGTHVASIIAGDGKASDGMLRGVAPKAQLVVQRLGEGLASLPLEITQLYAEAYKHAKILNLSWGSEVKSHYVLNSNDLDAFVASHPDFLVVVAAGNWGVQDLTEQGYPIGASTLGAPANAKNCLTVGACCSPRADGPYANKTWAQYTGNNAPTQLPMAGLPLTGDDAIVAANSSRGPSDDRRIKPDLVAVGVGVAAARSGDRGAPVQKWADSDQYMYLTGTSMAAPAVSGAAAIVRQYLRETRAHNQPSAALLKAILINGARWLPGVQQEDATIGQPNFHQGYGRLDLARAFPIDDNAKFHLNFIDIADSDADAVQMEKPRGAPASNWRGSFSVLDSNEPLSITLCWTDPPGRWLQHDLDLAVVDPTGKAYAGNNLLARAPGEKTDRLNNVERLVFDAPPLGEWVVMVKAFNTYWHPQGFGLAATGAITDWIA